MKSGLLLALAVTAAVLSLAGYFMLARAAVGRTLVVEDLAAKMAGKTGLVADEVSVEDRAAVDARFVSPNTVASFLQRVTGSARNLDVVAAFTSAEIKRDPARLDATLGASGTFTNIYRFVSTLENSPFAVAVSKVDIVAVEGKKNVWQARITLSAYLVRQ